jgi:hypothetical protein
MRRFRCGRKQNRESKTNIMNNHPLPIGNALLAAATLAVVAHFTLPAGAETMTFTATEDNTILSGPLANDNYGAYNRISSGTVGSMNQRSIMRFDVSALDGLYTSINSITLRVYNYDDNADNLGANVDVTTNVHAITAANRAWIEGTSTGGAATGQSTWNNRAHNTSSWAGSAGLGTVGTDYDSTVLASYTMLVASKPADGAAIDFTFTGTTLALTGLIDAWMVDNVNNSQANPGLLLRDPTPTPGGSRRNRFTMNSREATNPALHPQLIVEYANSSLPVTPLRLTIKPSDGNPDHYDFTWTSQAGKIYDLLSSDDLATPVSTWPVFDPDGPGGNQPFGDIPATADTTTLTAVPGNGPKRFFAIRQRQ